RTCAPRPPRSDLPRPCFPIRAPRSEFTPPLSLFTFHFLFLYDLLRPDLEPPEAAVGGDSPYLAFRGAALELHPHRNGGSKPLLSVAHGARIHFEDVAEHNPPVESGKLHEKQVRFELSRFDHLGRTEKGTPAALDTRE